MNLEQRVVIETEQQPWVNSPKAGVLRKPLAREHAEQGHATSVVKFAPGARFSEHDHPLGEEIFVLSGVFSDHSGDYPAGCYLRNPKGFCHSPFTEHGCTLLVKLHQFQATDCGHLHIDTSKQPWQAAQHGLLLMPLHQYLTESTALIKWPAGTRMPRHSHFGGEEVFVISGELIDEYGRYPAGTWIRSPHLSEHAPYVEQETLIWIKVGQL